MSWYDASRDNWGPVRRRMEDFKLSVPVAGPRGEMSADFRDIIRVAAQLGATRLRDEMPVYTEKTAVAILRWHANCRIGMAIQIASARHLLDRISIVRHGHVGGSVDRAAERATFGPGGPSSTVDGYHTAHYANFIGDTPWRDIGLE